MLILVAIALGLGVIFWSTKDKSTTSNNSSASSLSNHVFGEGKKGVNFTEYGDFQCPYCAAYYPIVKQVKEKYQADVTFQFRNFPLPQHQNARAGARAAEAASKQGKFWEMHDLLYENQKSWESSQNPNIIFESFASSLGLDLAKYKTDFASAEVNNTINADYAAGQKLGVDATPSFYLDGKKLDPTPQDLAGFSKVIDDAIKAKNK